jgi:hypothetical protein
MGVKMTLAEQFASAMDISTSVVRETLFVNCRTEHRNCDGDVYYQFADGSIYSVKDGASYFCLESMKDVLLETYGDKQEKCKTIDDLLKLKCA